MPRHGDQTATPDWQHPSTGDRPRAAAFLTLAITLIVSYSRSPALLQSPRFWAEEGSVYYAYAAAHDRLGTLVAPHLGYFSLVPNLATLLASDLVTVERAPIITTSIAFVCQVVPLLIVLFWPSPFWDTFAKRLLLVVLILVSPTGEIWLTTIAAPFHLSLAAALLLLTDSEGVSDRQRWLGRIALAIASITGPTTILLAPGFLYAALVQRTRERWYWCSIVATGSVVQLVEVPWSVHEAGVFADRFTGLNPHDLLAIYLDNSIAHAFLFQTTFNAFPRLNLVTTVAVVVVLAYAWQRARSRPAIVGFAAFSGLSLILSSGNRGGERYFFTSGVLLYVLCTDQVAAARRLPQLFALVLLACAVTRGSASFWSRMTPFIQPEWPTWKAEVDRWRSDPSYAPRIHPCWGEADWRVSMPVAGRPGT